MTSDENRPDEELLERYRRASEGQPASPSAAVRAAILAEGRRAADARSQAREPGQTLDASRPAADDSRWKIAAFGTAGAALVAALLFAPRLWENAPLPQPPKSASLSATESKRAKPPAAPSASAAQSARSAQGAPAAQGASAAQSAQVAPNAPTAASDRAAPVASTAWSLSAGRARTVPQAAELRSAAATGDAAQTAALLDQGAAVDGRDEHGRTPLMLAVMLSRPDVVRVLLARGADPNIADDTGRTPLQQAKQESQPEIAALLETAGAR
jgi:hypothetical protein